MATNKKDHLRYRYGICLNDNGACSKAKSKEVQQIASRKDFVCEECQKPLRECPPPKSFWSKYGKLLIGAAGILVAAAIVVCILNMPSKSHEADAPAMLEDTPEQVGSPETDVLNPADTLAQEPAPEQEPASAPAQKPEPVRSSIQVPFGTYSGPANGLDGEIKVTRKYTLDLRNAAHDTIELLPGDVITRTKFKDGELVGGYWKRGSESRSFHR